MLYYLFRSFQWYRRARGGKWGKTSGLFYGQNWHKLPGVSKQWHEWWCNVRLLKIKD